MFMFRITAALLLSVLWSCNDIPSNGQEDSLQNVTSHVQTYDSWISPIYYTDFDISNMATVTITWDSKEVKEFSSPYSVKITNKKLNTSVGLWSFSLDDSLCACNNYYIELRNKTTSKVYSFSVSIQDTIVDLTSKRVLTELPWD